MPAKKIRNIEGRKIEDQPVIINNQYSNSAGAEKNTEVGRHLVPLDIDGATWTTDATTARKLPAKGRNIAVYNNSSTLYAITLGNRDEAAMVALAPGVTDANKRVGIACKPNDWTYIACYEQQDVISQNVALLVYLIEDDSFIKVEALK